MTQIVGDATHIKGKALSGSLAPGETWVFDGEAMVPAANEAFRTVEVEGALLTATGSSDLLTLSGVSGISLAASQDSGEVRIQLGVSGLAPEQIPHWDEISGTAWGGSGLASGASGIALIASGVALGASGIAAAASGTASGASGIATGASGIAAGASGIAVTASGMASGASGMASGASGIAAGASAMAQYASGKLDDLDGASGLVLSSGSGFLVFSAPPASGYVLKSSGTNLLNDLYWGVDQTGSGGVGSGNSYAYVNVHGTLVDANAADDTLNISGRSGILLSAVSGAGQGADVIYVEVSGLSSGQIPYWSEISGMAASSPAAGGAAVSPDYIPPSFLSKDADEIYLPPGRYHKAGFRWRGQYRDTVNMQDYWDIDSRLAIDLDATYASGSSPGMIGGAKVNSSWYSVFLLGTAANDVLVLPFVRVKAIAYSAPYTTINPADHSTGAANENGFFAADDAWNDYRLVKWSLDLFDGTLYTVADSVNGSPDQIVVSGDKTSEISAGDWLQLVPPSSVPCLFLGLVRIDSSGNLAEFRTVAEASSSTGTAVKGTVEGRIDRSSDTELIWNPVAGQGLGLWFNDQWQLVTPAHAISLSNTALDLEGNALTYNSNYDVFAEGDGTPFNFRLVAKKWTNDTTRSQSLGRFHGVLVYDKDSDAGRRRRFLGTVRLRNDGGTAKFSDSDTRRFVSNYYNEVSLVFSCSVNASGATFNSASWAIWSNWASPGIAFVLCAPRSAQAMAVGQAQTTSDSKRPEYSIFLDGAAVGVVACNIWDANAWAKTDTPAMYHGGALAAGYHYVDYYRRLSSSSSSNSAQWQAFLTGAILP